MDSSSAIQSVCIQLRNVMLHREIFRHTWKKILSFQWGRSCGCPMTGINDGEKSAYDVLKDSTRHFIADNQQQSAVTPL